MNQRDLANVVVAQLESFFRLQYLDDLLTRNDETAVELMNRLYARRQVGWRDIHPLVCIQWTVGQLFIPVSFALSRPECQSLSIRPEYALVYRENGNQVPATIQAVLRVIRNALINLSDHMIGDVYPSVSFEEGIVKFQASSTTQGQDDRTAELVFYTEDGFVGFLNDLFRFVRSQTNSLVKREPDVGLPPTCAKPPPGDSPRAVVREQNDSRVNERSGAGSPPGDGSGSAFAKEGTAASDQDWKKLLSEGWRLIREFAPIQPDEVAELPREVNALTFWAKMRLHEMEGISPTREHWQAVVAMAIEAAYRIGCQKSAPSL